MMNTLFQILFHFKFGTITSSHTIFLILYFVCEYLALLRYVCTHVDDVQIRRVWNVAVGASVFRRQPNDVVIVTVLVWQRAMSLRNQQNDFVAATVRWWQYAMSFQGPQRNWIVAVVNLESVPWAVLPFSKLNKMFFGYFDPENIFFDNKNK